LNSTLAPGSLGFAYLPDYNHLRPRAHSRVNSRSYDPGDSWLIDISMADFDRLVGGIEGLARLDPDAPTPA
jgi:hypothetical protein